MACDQSLDRPCRVLVVDDDPDTAASWCELLRVWGFQVDVALDGHDALRLARERPPDAVLLDLGLPGLDGYEVARRLRDRHGREPLVVALSGRAQPLDRVASADAGCDLHLAKPADPEQVRRALMGLRDDLSSAPGATT